MIKWIRNNEEFYGGEYKFKVGEEEYVSYNPTEDFLLEQGWTKVEEPDPVPEPRSLKSVKDEIIRECNEFYRSSILQVDFKGNLLWVPFETRQAYRILLEDIKSAGGVSVVFRDVELEIAEAIQILKDLNVYEYEQKQICDQHVRNIIKLQDEDSIYSYDYTSNYRDNLSF